MDFEGMPKISRLMRPVIVTEKLDGTNAFVYIEESPWPLPDFTIRAGSKNRWITPDNDNMGFAKWVQDNTQELILLGPGLHYGEWWGQGIQRNYAQTEKRFSLFNTARWSGCAPSCCSVVPVFWRGVLDTDRILNTLYTLKDFGSIAAPGFMKPEGLVVFHTHSNEMYKITLDGDGRDKAKPKLRTENNQQTAAPFDPNRSGRRKGCEEYKGYLARSTDHLLSAATGVDSGVYTISEPNPTNTFYEDRAKAALAQHNDS